MFQSRQLTNDDVLRFGELVDVKLVPDSPSKVEYVVYYANHQYILTANKAASTWLENPYSPAKLYH